MYSDTSKLLLDLCNKTISELFALINDHPRTQQLKVIAVYCLCTQYTDFSAEDFAFFAGRAKLYYYPRGETELDMSRLQAVLGDEESLYLRFNNKLYYYYPEAIRADQGLQEINLQDSQLKTFDNYFENMRVNSNKLINLPDEAIEFIWECTGHSHQEEDLVEFSQVASEIMQRVQMLIAESQCNAKKQRELKELVSVLIGAPKPDYPSLAALIVERYGYANLYNQRGRILQPSKAAALLAVLKPFAPMQYKRKARQKQDNTLIEQIFNYLFNKFKSFKQSAASPHPNNYSDEILKNLISQAPEVLIVLFASNIKREGAKQLCQFMLNNILNGKFNYYWQNLVTILQKSPAVCEILLSHLPDLFWQQDLVNGKSLINIWLEKPGLLNILLFDAEGEPRDWVNEGFMKQLCKQEIQANNSSEKVKVIIPLVQLLSVNIDLAYAIFSKKPQLLAQIPADFFYSSFEQEISNTRPCCFTMLVVNLYHSSSRQQAMNLLTLFFNYNPALIKNLTHKFLCTSITDIYQERMQASGSHNDLECSSVAANEREEINLFVALIYHEQGRQLLKQIFTARPDLIKAVTAKDLLQSYYFPEDSEQSAKYFTIYQKLRDFPDLYRLFKNHNPNALRLCKNQGLVAHNSSEEDVGEYTEYYNKNENSRCASQ